MWSDAGEYDSYLSFGRVSRPALFSEAPAVRTVSCFIHLLHEVLFMRSVLSVSVDDELKAKIEHFIREHDISRSELVKGALRRFLYIQEFRKLREELTPYAEARGYFTDEDIFRDIS